MENSGGHARAVRGRPAATSHAEIEQVAFRLFAVHGFESTTMEMIAEAVGIGRRTLFRYFESKNDIPWGRFDDTLAEFRRLLATSAPGTSMVEVVNRAVIEFNRFDSTARPPHRERMSLILRTPALQAHSALRYAEWRRVIEEFVADRTGVGADSLLPSTVGRLSLALALAAYDLWLADPESDLLELLTATMRIAGSYFRDLDSGAEISTF